MATSHEQKITTARHHPLPPQLLLLLLLLLHMLIGMVHLIPYTRSYPPISLVLSLIDTVNGFIFGTKENVLL